MAIAYKSQGAGAGTETSGASLNLVAPATVDANDILIAHVMHTGTTTAPSTPANWSLLYGPANVGVTTVTARHWIFGKLADGTEDGATIGFGTAGGTNGRAGRIYSYSGYVSGTLADVVPAASFSDIPHDTDPQGPSVTTTVAGALAIAAMCQDDNNTKTAITGMTGGTWSESVAEYIDTALGPQGLVMVIDHCTPTGDPGTVSGGASGTANDESGTIGFEIRPSVPANPALFEASVSAVATIAAALTTAIEMAASAVAAATIAAVLTTEIVLAGSVSGAANTSADLTTEITMAGSVTSQATVVADLTTQITLAATVNAIAETVADLTAGAQAAQFDASVNAVATTQGSLETEIRLQGALSAAATAVGGLDTAIELAASVACSATMQGTIGEPAVITWKPTRPVYRDFVKPGNLLELDIITETPTNAPPLNVGVAVKVVGGVATIYVWDGTQWVAV